jgi:plastocyanin
MRFMKLGTPARVAMLAVAVPALLLAACGDDGDSTDDVASATATQSATAVRTATTTATASTTATGTAAAGQTVEVTAVDYKFEGLPATVKSGTKLTMTNASTGEAHELVAIRLPDDEKRPVSELITLPEEQLGEIVSNEPAAVLIAAPGDDAMAVVGDGTLEESGRYAIVCFIPVGADPAEILAPPPADDATPPAEEEPSGPPHASQGMYAELTVE